MAPFIFFFLTKNAEMVHLLQQKGKEIVSIHKKISKPLQLHTIKVFGTNCFMSCEPQGLAPVFHDNSYHSILFLLLKYCASFSLCNRDNEEAGACTAYDTGSRSAYHKLKSIRVHLAAGSVEVKTVYITVRSNAHVSNICGRAKCARGVYAFGIHALAYFRYCIPAVKRTPRTLLMRHTANFVSGLRRNSRSG